MPLFRGLSDAGRCRGGFVAIGNFDGVHRGHRAMIAELRRRADAAGLPAVVVTFDPPPGEVLRPDSAPPRLMRLEEKAEHIVAAGADAVIALQTDRAMLGLTAEAFFDDVLRDRLDVRGLVEGPDFRFGRGREGDVELLARLARQAGIAFQVIEPQQVDGRMVSSSLVRRCISEGDLIGATDLLGRPHEAIGVVGRGAGRGGPLGFPTANLVGITTLLPPDGVYASRTAIDDRMYPAAVHLGPNATFGEADRTFEAHLLGFSGDLYGRTLRVELLDRVRESRRFESAAELVAQMRRDCGQVAELVAAHPGGG